MRPQRRSELHRRQRCCPWAPPRAPPRASVSDPSCPEQKIQICCLIIILNYVYPHAGHALARHRARPPLRAVGRARRGASGLPREGGGGLRPHRAHRAARHQRAVPPARHRHAPPPPRLNAPRTRPPHAPARRLQPPTPPPSRPAPPPAANALLLKGTISLRSLMPVEISELLALIGGHLLDSAGGEARRRGDAPTPGWESAPPAQRRRPPPSLLRTLAAEPAPTPPGFRPAGREPAAERG